MSTHLADHHTVLFQGICLREILAVAAASLGAVLAVGFRKISHFWLCVLISFAAGALLSVSFLDIFPETFELVGIMGGLLSAGSGYLLFFLITRFVFHICPACAATHTEVNFKAVTAGMVVALAVHSFMDGLAIFSGSVAGAPIGVPILLAVVFHKFPEGMALALVARSSGMTRRAAFLVAFGLEGITTLAGGIVGYFMLSPAVPQWIGYVLGHVAGGFVFLVIHALLSEAIKHHPKSTLLAAFVGAASVAAVGLL
jgi:ZIP family zinc transporter